MGKKILNLNGSWNFRTDPKGIGESEQWYRKGFTGQLVDVPAVWQSYNHDLVKYTGYAWYSKEFTFEHKENDRIFIKLEAVDYLADLWLNGKYLGSHEGGYTPFGFEITELLTEKEHILVVRVYDPANNEEIPHGKQGSWYTRASGIWQDVSLVKYGAGFIENVLIKPEVDLEQVGFKIKLNSADRVNNPVLDIKIFAKGEDPLSHQFMLQPDDDYLVSLPQCKLWEPENPYLYNLEISLKDGERVVDQFASYFGMRKVETRDGRIYLNNKPLYIRGALDQAFWPETIYRAKSKDMIIDEIKKAKEMGFNLLRKHIKTEDPRYLEWADKLGLLIWAEPANYTRWTPQARERFKKEYTAMVNRDYNHPSIIIWGIYNEEWGLEGKLRDNKEMQDWLKDFYQYAKDLDSSRLLCDNSGWSHIKTDINDYHRYFAIPENYQEWRQDLEQYVIARSDQNFVDGYTAQNEPIMISEFGMWGLPELDGVRTGEYPYWFKENQGHWGEDFKLPGTALKNFKKYQLDRIFSDFNQLALASQDREHRGVKYLIEEIRKRADIAGYVVTELSDIEWETNGFLKYNREFKSFSDQVNCFNEAVNVMLDLEKHNLWTKDLFRAVPYIVNNTALTFNGTLKWELAGTGIKGSIDVSIKSYSVTRVNDQIVFKLPDLNQSKDYNFKYGLLKDGKEIARNSEEITITPTAQVMVSGNRIVTANLSNEFKKKLIANGYIVDSRPAHSRSGRVCLTGNLNQKIINDTRRGGKTLFLAEKGSSILEKGGFNFEKLPDGESWVRAATFNFIDNTLFKQVPLNKISGWELADLYASYVINNLDDLGYQRIISGIFAGWIGKLAASTLLLKMGKGYLVVSTLKLEKQYNHQPIGTILLNSLIQYLDSLGGI